MLVSEKHGIITDVSSFNTNDGSELVSISYTSGKGDKILKVYLSKNNENFEIFKQDPEAFIGQKVISKIEILS